VQHEKDFSKDAHTTTLGGGNLISLWGLYCFHFKKGKEDELCKRDAFWFYFSSGLALLAIRH
jgi:hypothetical protein